MYVLAERGSHEEVLDRDSLALVPVDGTKLPMVSPVRLGDDDVFRLCRTLCEKGWRLFILEHLDNNGAPRYHVVLTRRRGEVVEEVHLRLIPLSRSRYLLVVFYVKPHERGRRLLDEVLSATCAVARYGKARATTYI